MPHLSSAERTALRMLRAAEADATTALSLASRALAILEDVLRIEEGYILAVDPDSLLFTRLLAYRGDRFGRFVEWLRDVYFVVDTRIAPDLSFPAILRNYGGFAALHERVDRWIGTMPRPAEPDRFADLWRQAGSPPGGGFRLGFRDRGGWVAAMQAGRWTPGEGYRPHDLEVLRRASPGLARALRARLEPFAGGSAGATPPPAPGHLLFDPNRRLAFADRDGEDWMERLPEDGVRAHGMAVPIAVQSLVNCVWAGAAAGASSRLVDRFGYGVAIEATHARQMRMPLPTRPTGWVHVTIGASPVASRLARRSLTERQRQVGRWVARGLDDVAIGARLGVARSTVHDHVGALHAAFGTRSRAALVAALREASPTTGD